MTEKQIWVTKASGEEEPFSVDKLKRSLRNAGADKAIIDKIVEEMYKWLYHGVTTKKIYSHAFSLLKKQPDVSGLRYRLKRAILELGPSGYPFETLIGQLFEKQGYSTEVGVVVDGTCVTHEMDVIATHNNQQHLVECKYSKHQGKQVGVQVPLYVHSRVDDIVKKRRTIPATKNYHFEGWVVTNTRFSEDSIQYGKCSGLNLLAWDYPHGKGLKNLIEDYKIYPITILRNLTKAHKKVLLEQGVVTCNQLSQKMNSLDKLKLTAPRLKRLKNELAAVV
ncbi:ATP cone domain protein [Salinivirga cyanobacteriivorans]|uniref:ATP cone domain protein n=1 Tax=Salinivirga cyanobacteriivorans TaxID=1307839 RepID=A0A0S2HXW1_9BACT|nr:restriction endonuclease [Salinivirga cyanobacteriivorans]ALO14806.1 ATP cone domain protein [Salinivirga cyanobacteriivorans]